MSHIIYTKSECRYCKIAKEWLKSNAISFTEQSLDDNEIKELFKAAYPHIRSVPVVFDAAGNEVVQWKNASAV